MSVVWIFAGGFALYLLHELALTVIWYRATFSKENKARRLPRGGSFRSLHKKHRHD